ncbi:MAG TPA: pimeloyl-ACP methyl esterase BioG family protein [Bacteroidales bacterium]|nr:pimeloyl-ACP methyl esterase BioG family protein [Bacteroidales bacterium]
MKTYIRRREKNTQLVVFYGGWGSDENTFVSLCNDEFDFIMFYNYSADEPLILPEMKTYERIILIAWSLGVWAAEYMSLKTKIRPDLTIAVNGTPLPADETYGIPLNIIEGTLNNITEENIGKFYLRMFGSKKSFEANAERMPRRTLKSLHDELRWLYNRMMEQKEPGFKWDYAVTSLDDRVYPSKNLELYWNSRNETKLITLPLPHYFFHKWNTFMDFITFVEHFSSAGAKEQKIMLKRIKDL